ncbi:C39 family peptidase [uncultured Thiodictyon sp.]|uniref:InlB B-repeat-containing protein n=1 Tax=uncultured Thiodictyon sp. TaxID=1846217 RepID=UPI0025DC052F|nr:C39 family peptidase [uncultured Thiodictyon sp.]
MPRSPSVGVIFGNFLLILGLSLGAGMLPHAVAVAGGVPAAAGAPASTATGAVPVRATDAMVQNALQRLETVAGAGIAITKSPRTGLVTYLGAAPGQAIPTLGGATAQERGRLFLGAYGGAFGISAPDQLRADGVFGPDAMGVEHVRFLQQHNGIVVYGGEIVVNLTQGAVGAVVANTLPDLGAVDKTPRVTPAQALAAAGTMLAAHLKVTAATLSTPQLQIFNRGLFDGQPASSRLTWFIEATGTELREFIWVDAQLGEVLLHVDRLDRANVNRVDDRSGDTLDYTDQQTVTSPGGPSIERRTIKGPPVPPPGSALQRSELVLPGAQVASAVTLTVPAFNWSFGCSATSGAMIAAFYDRNGMPNMYTGPTNAGVMPLDSSSWPNWTDGAGATYGQCPLTASHQGLDGRATRGSIDDYWVAYNSTASDPYVTGAWAQHAWGDAIGDYMKTSQSAYSNTDGSTTFYNWTTSGAPLTCADMVTYGIQDVDGTYGRKLFYEAKGYSVTDCFSRNTDNNVAGGFGFADYQAQIDAGRPVFLNLAGHSIVGVGYDAATSTVYVHDTWDYGTHTMPWGGSYSGMQLLSVSIVNLAASSTTYTVTASAGTGGSVSPASRTVSSGAMAQFTVTPNTGYSTNTAVGGTCPAGSWSGSDYTTGAIAGNCTVSFSFSVQPSLGQALDNTSLTWTTNGNANWAGETLTTHDGVDAAQSGAMVDSQSSNLNTVVTGPGSLTFFWKVSSENGWDYLRFTSDGTALFSITGEVDWQQQTVDIPTGQHTIAWSYTKDGSVSVGQDAGWVDTVVFTPSPTSYTVTASAGTGGSVSPASRTVASGATAQFAVTPNTGYSTNTAVGGTCPAGSWSGSNYTTGAVTANCTLSFSFTLSSYTVTASAGTGGSVSPASLTVNSGATAQFTVTPNTGYSTNTAVGGTCPAGSWSGSSYTTGAVTANCTVSFSFTATGTSYTVTASAGTGGSVSPASRTVTSGATAQFTVTPNTGYTTNSAVGGTCPAGSWSGSSYTTGAVTGNCAVSFAFVRNITSALPSRGGWRAILR